MAASLIRYPNGMGGYTLAYPCPVYTRDVNEWLHRVGADKQGFKISTKNNGCLQELKRFDKTVIRVKLKNSASLTPLCQIASEKYGIKIDWYNPVHWRERFAYPEDIQIQFLE